MTEARHAGRHSAATAAAPPASEDVASEDVWVPPPYEPTRPGDFIEYASVGFEVKTSHRGLKWLVTLVLVAALAGGGWWFFLRDPGDGTSLPTCQVVQQAVASVYGDGIHITEGGRIPTGIPAPSDTPDRVCAMAANHRSVVLGMWPGAAEADYTALLAAGGWTVTSQRSEVTVHVNGADPRRVATATIDGVLVVAYEH